MEEDDHVLDFIEKLSNHNIKYVVTSGFIETSVEQNRINSDVEILIRNVTFEKFLKFWLELEKTYECLDTDDPIDAYNGYLRNHHAIRIRKLEVNALNFILRFVKNDLDRALLKYRKYAKLKDKKIYVSSLEIMIPYKLSMGSGKDIEDAISLFERFKDELNTELLEKFLKELEIPEQSANKYLGKL
ncbi:MAG: hypothetical protein O8C59_04830 [Candidatus Methanoperedens sp.]|nr:hypothetical protein [Candidatus Methanoperedens sp.]